MHKEESDFFIKCPMCGEEAAIPTGEDWLCTECGAYSVFNELSESE